MNKRTAIISTASLVAAGGLSAAAFITATSTGTGHATQGTERPSITTTVAVPTVDFGRTGTVVVSVHNDSTHVNVHPTTVTAGSLTVTPTGTNTCPAGSFTVTGLTSLLPLTLVPGQTATVANATLNFVDLPLSDQTGCLGADVAISATVS